jgi:hypothetical protein
MSGIATQSKIGAAIGVAALVAMVILEIQKMSPTVMAIPAAIGWGAALWALKPMVPAHKQSELYFAFGVMAFLFFFLHETYLYQGKLRYFPLIIGWTGVLLSTLDILSVTDTRVGAVVNLIFGSVRSESLVEGRQVGREIACFAAMASSVLLIWFLGFLIAAPLFVILWMRLWGGKTFRMSFYGGVSTFAFIWIMFEWLLQYELFRGVAVEWLIERLWG